MQRKRKTLARPSLEADVKRQGTERGGASCVTSGLQMDVILGGGLICARLVGMAGCPGV